MAKPRADSGAEVSLFPFLSILACIIGALVLSLMTTPDYRSTATVQIERHNPEILTHQDLSRIDYSWAAYSDFYQTQYNILQSRAVSRLASERMDLVNQPEYATRQDPPIRRLLRWIRPSPTSDGTD